MIAKIAALPAHKIPEATKLLEVWWKGREMPTLQSARAAQAGAQEAELAATDATRARYLADPVSWAHEKLGEHFWSKQASIIASVRDNRRTAVHSAHNLGKSMVSSRVACWWLDAHRPGDAFVISSAPTDSQVRAILWREINRAHAKGHLFGRVNQTEWWALGKAGNEEIIAMGRKPQDQSPTAFQGIHQRYVLIIFDEATGITPALWEAADTLMSNEDSKFLAIGNPDDMNTEFGTVCKPGSGWNVIGISAFDSPNFTGEEVPEVIRHALVGPTWVEEKRRKWGEDNPLYISKVLGRFPEKSTSGLIPISWIRAAQLRDLSALAAAGPSELGVDVGAGGDKNVIAHRRGPVVRIIREDSQPDTMISCGNLIRDLDSTGAAIAKVDYIGVGRGLVDRAKEQSKPVRGVSVSARAIDPEHYANLRAEGYWGLRERFETGDIDIDPDDDDLAAQLANIKRKPTSAGKELIVSKKDSTVATREVRQDARSPDRADAVMLAFIVPPSEDEYPDYAVW